MTRRISPYLGLLVLLLAPILLPAALLLLMLCGSLILGAVLLVATYPDVAAIQIGAPCLLALAFRRLQTRGRAAHRN